jgi:plastocyanin
VVRGTVTFKGTPPEGEDVEGSRCHPGAATIHVAPVTVGADGSLKDVMVYVKDPPAAPAAGSEPPAVLDQVNCRYVPRVLGVRVGQLLRVTSSDPAVHNVHTLSDRNPRLNFGMTGAGQSRDVTFERSEQFPVRCDVHPWMTATVHVFDHPFFAVSDDDGRFGITDLPPGEHEVVFSHPFLGERSRKVTVGAEAVVVDVTFERGQ